MLWPFELHRSYHRRNDIHARFGGQQQGGISTPAEAPGIFIFTGHGAGHVGYQDVFGADGSFRYTGQGQLGDMRMISGNRAIRDHVQNGKDLLLFQQTQKGGLVRFEGLYVCGGWEIEQQPDMDGQPRQAIVFTLVPQNGLSIEAEDLATEAPADLPLAELRERALQAAFASNEASPRVALMNVRARSKAVRDYVLARARGSCENCRSAAPFLTATRQPYLETHHIHKLSDGGPDHPASVAALCPNCHREAHFGVGQVLLNDQLLEHVQILEKY
ncbi:HNH endonuclease [Gluconobacter kondonii]|uniref:HNH endonuclease n=1 Tax=Gluconobacter kondonii TaxID=941463 RepID=UPI001B8C2746|nr:HNH endonuclease signature motif containing protein [Gluconobacter kondonii]MBS1084447.1 HNH endonuclease [Gluconobacter kondonii]